ncbi:MAG: two-component system response regulator [bacterium]|nr:MAG: two-component system response regulator [bacterium]
MNNSEYSLLIVDDNEMNRDLLSRRLNKCGFATSMAKDGMEALSMIEAEDYDLMLLDIMMPKMDGHQVLAYMKSSEKLRHIPVIMISSVDETNTVVKCIEMGAEDYLPKPFNPVLLNARIRASLEKKLFHDNENAYRRLIEKNNTNLEERVQRQAEEIVSAQHGMIFVMSKLTESRDPDTGTHLERLRDYCEVLARNMSKLSKYAGIIDEQFIEDICTASPLHDIGKVGVPDNILLKPGKLTEQEWIVMHRHPIIGSETLRALDTKYLDNSLVRKGIEIVESHHEKWNGLGYPYRLTKERIPLSARILALADVFDALMSKRCYKDALPYEEARKIIISERERHFDPGVVDAFIRSEKEFQEIQKTYSGERNV